MERDLLPDGEDQSQGFQVHGQTLQYLVEQQFQGKPPTYEREVKNTAQILKNLNQLPMAIP